MSRELVDVDGQLFLIEGDPTDGYGVVRLERANRVGNWRRKHEAKRFLLRSFGEDAS